MTIARVLPNSLEAEQAVLACILLDEEVPLTAFTNLRAEDFYSKGKMTHAYQRDLFYVKFLYD